MVGEGEGERCRISRVAFLGRIGTRSADLLWGILRTACTRPTGRWLALGWAGLVLGWRWKHALSQWTGIGRQANRIAAGVELEGPKAGTNARLPVTEALVRHPRHRDATMSCTLGVQALNVFLDSGRPTAC